MSLTSPEKQIINKEKMETSIIDDVLHLEEVVETIFSYLNYDTLCIVQDVCRLWKEKAHERFLKNYPPFSTILPNIFITEDHLCFCEDHDVFANDTTVKNIIKTEPEKVTILLCPYNMGERAVEGYLQLLPYESIAVNEFTYVDDVNLDTTENLMAAVLFPKIPSIKIRSSIVLESTIDKYLNSSGAFTELFDLDSKEKQNCLIILGTNMSCDIDDEPEYKEKNFKFITKISNYLKKMNSKLKLTVWGGASATLFHSNTNLNIQSIHWHVLNIIGINSYSIALNLHLNEENFKKKLRDFKNTITLKKESFALAIAHTTNRMPSEPREQIIKKVLLFKDIFNIKLTTILSCFSKNVHYTPHIFCNASDNVNFKIKNKNLNIQFKNMEVNKLTII